MTPTTYNVTNPSELREALQQFADRQEAIEKSILALTSMLGVLVRRVDAGPAARAIPGMLTKEMLEVSNVLEASGHSTPMLGYLRALLESAELNPPPPPKGGTHLRIVGGTEGPETKAA